MSDLITALIGVSGLGMGVLDVLGLAYVFDGWRKTMPKAGQTWPFRFRVLSVFVSGLFLNGLFILTPFTVSRLTNQTMAVTLGEALTWIWAIAVNVAPYLLVGGIVTAQSGVVKVAQEEKSAPELSKSESATLQNPREIVKPARKDWRHLSHDEKSLVAGFKNARYLATAFEIPESTARDWMKRARELRERK